jgi:excisionase family DNA binding protein
MRFTFELPDGSILGAHEAALLIAILTRNGVRPYYYRRGNKITFGDGKYRTEVFFDDVEEIRESREGGVEILLKGEGKIAIKDGEISREGEAPTSGSTYSIPDAAEILGIQPSTIYRWIYAGKLHAVGERRQKRIRREEVEAMKGASKWITRPWRQCICGFRKAEGGYLNEHEKVF